ncbi:hypothetical protein H5410_038518 [Solanum commersonii]|uniref:DNA helicase Pif1-like 2B domain-containing protein n=1 Tax=Solanum commersonii TaxID=4109 RepID=A0A9J5YE58_SOLCO|nr:hypothetical protein H5410_038518 [Solanum commersonii]
MDIDKPFGGKVMVLEEIFGIQFTRNMRARTRSNIGEFLLGVGNGDEPTIRDNLILLLSTMFPVKARYSIALTQEDDTNNYYEEYLNTLTPKRSPPHRLELKENAPIMLVRNLDPSSGL